MVLEQGRHEQPIELREPGEPAFAPAGQAVIADPEGAVTCGEEAVDAPARHLLTGRRLPPDETNAVEVKQTELAPQPQVSLGCLRHREDSTEGEAVAHPPRGVRVLADLE
jgi:hypothetical protein